MPESVGVAFPELGDVVKMQLTFVYFSSLQVFEAGSAFKKAFSGLPWWSSGQDSVLPMCRSPAPAARDSTWSGGWCQRVTTQPLNFLGLRIYFKFKIFFYTFTKALGQRFDIFSSPSPRFIISINHCCSSNRVPASAILSESALPSSIYFLLCVL